MRINIKQYKLIPPDRGWGYIIASSVAITFTVTIHQHTVFGIVYGHYLRQITNEGSATAMISGFYCTLLNFMGLVVSRLIRKHSVRYIGIIGSVLFFIGNMLSVFASSLWQLTLAYGVVQATGIGIMYTTVISSFNEYFFVKKNFIMGLIQTFIAAIALIVPYFSQILLDEFGYRGTVALLAAISLHSLFAMLTLQPVKRHMIKVPLSDAEMSYLKLEYENIMDSTKLVSTPIEDCSRINQFRSLLSKFLLVSLLKDPVYVNIIIGLSIVFISDIMFISLLPMFLNNAGYSNDDTIYMMIVYTTSDFIGRLLFSFLCSFIKIKMRILVLIGFILTTVFRMIFTFYFGEWVVTFILLTTLGLLRSFVQIPIPLVLAEYCNDINFPSVYGVYSATLAVTSIISGQLASVIALHTTTDTGVLHFLTLHLFLCIITWITEMIYRRKIY